MDHLWAQISETLSRVSRKPNANQYDTYDPRAFNPLGQRLLEAMKSAGYSSPRTFAIQALGSASKGGNLSTQLQRLTADKPDGGLMIDQIVAYAKAARVSLFWLCTGEGAKTMGPYGELTGEEMRAIPEELARATRALMELDGKTPKLAMWAASEALSKHGGGYLKPVRWLERMRELLEDTGNESGLRPSASMRAASDIRDPE